MSAFQVDPVYEPYNLAAEQVIVILPATPQHPTPAAVRGRLLGAMHYRGQVHHYRVEMADGWLLLVPPGWVRFEGVAKRYPHPEQDGVVDCHPTAQDRQTGGSERIPAWCRPSLWPVLLRLGWVRLQIALLRATMPKAASANSTSTARRRDDASPHAAVPPVLRVVVR